MNNKKTKLILGLGTGITPLLVPTLVVSCNNEGVDLTKNETLLDSQFKLLDSKSTITANDFINLCSKEGIIKTFSTYTNYVDIENKLRKQGIFIHSITNLAWIEGTNSIEFYVSYKDSSNNVFAKYSYRLNGFIFETNKIDDIVSSFEKNVSGLLSANISSLETSEDIFNKWWETNQDSRFSVLCNYINGIPISIVNNGLYNGASVVVKSNFNNEIEEAKKVVYWNDTEENNSVKGTILYVTFVFTIQMPDREISKELKVSIAGYTSFQQRIDIYSNEFKSKKGNITIKNSNTTAAIVAKEYELAKDNEKINTLSKYLNNIPSPTTPINSVYYKLIDIEASLILTNGITLKFNVEWNGISKEVSFEVSSFLSDQEYFENLKIHLLDLYLTPSNEGAILSSEEVYNKYNEDQTSLKKYVNDIPTSSTCVTYTVDNVSWDETSTIENRGSTLYLSIKLSYAYSSDKKLETISNTTVQGFTTPFSRYLLDFNKKCDAINLQAIESEASKVIVDKVNLDNWKTYVTGIPENTSDLLFNVDELIFKYNNGLEGQLGISFLYSWVTPLGNKFVRTISKDIPGFKTYKQESKESFDDLTQKLSSSNYMDSIKKSNANYANWFTSYFGYGRSTNNDKIEALSQVWNLPLNYFGIEFTIQDLTYSNTNNTLSNTQLKIVIEIKDEYSDSTFTSPAYVIDGFADPYDSTIYDFCSKPENYELNNSQNKKYSTVNSLLKMGEANSQPSAVRWFMIEPYIFYYDGVGTNYAEENRKKWIEFAKTKLKSIVLASSKPTDNFIAEVKDVEYIWKGYIKHGNIGSDGTVPAPIKFSVAFNTTAVDKMGNSASGKYPEKISQKLILWLYFKNCYWN